MNVETTFEFKQPIIISKTPSITYAFQLSDTHSITKTYNEKVDYSIIVNENKDFVYSLIESFSNKCSKFFSKPLDIYRLLSRLAHSDYAVNMDENGDCSEPIIYEWKYTPYRIVISGTEFKIEWCVDQVEIKCIIDISGEDEINELQNTKNCIDVVVKDADVVTNVDTAIEVKNNMKESSTFEEPPEVQLSEVNIPVSDDSTPISIKIDGRTEDYKRLKKAQLRVEMAKFKAERAYAKYVERWGYLSEDSGSDSE